MLGHEPVVFTPTCRRLTKKSVTSPKFQAFFFGGFDPVPCQTMAFYSPNLLKKPGCGGGSFFRPVEVASSSSDMNLRAREVAGSTNGGTPKNHPF